MPMTEKQRATYEAIASIVIAIVVVSWFTIRAITSPSPPVVTTPAVEVLTPEMIHERAILMLLGIDGKHVDEDDPTSDPIFQDYDRLSREFTACFRGKPETVLQSLGAICTMSPTFGPAMSPKVMLTLVPRAVAARRQATGQLNKTLDINDFLGPCFGAWRTAPNPVAAINQALDEAWDK